MVTLTTLALVGALIQVVAERRDAAAFPPPGELVELPDGRALHLQVFGEQHDGPTVVLEAGAGAPSVAWAWIQPLVAQRYTVVSYDRAGLGWSDPASHGTTAAAVVEDLHSALQVRGLSGPYVLVGHSLGAHYVRAFAATHADEVSGVVLVDPSHEDQLRVLGEDGDPTQMRSMFTALRAATLFGLTRLYNPLTEGLEGLPEPARSQVLAQMHATGRVEAITEEYLAINEVGADIAGTTVGDVPLRVLVADGAPTAKGQAMVDALAPLRENLAASLSKRGDAVHLPTAQHVTIVTEREHAEVVAEHILNIADRAADPND